MYKSWKKKLALILVFVMTVAMMPDTGIVITLADEQRDACVEHAYVNGICEGCGAYQEATATAVQNSTVYEIANAGQLYWFADYVNSGHTVANAKLTADITVNSSGEEGKTFLETIAFDESGAVTNDKDFIQWTPIGKDNRFSYAGIFDGNQYSISGLYLNEEDDNAYVGLFGWNGSGTGSNVGGIAGYNDGSIDNCYYLSGDWCTSFTNIEGEEMSEAEFASGKVAYLLQSGQEAEEEGEEAPQVWYQNIDNDGTADKYPVLDATHGIVYQCSPCTGAYSNTEGKTVEHEDKDLNGACDACDEEINYTVATTSRVENSDTSDSVADLQGGGYIVNRSLSKKWKD